MGRLVRMAEKPPDANTSGSRMNQPMIERISMTWKTSSAGMTARPATVMVRKETMEPPIQSAALSVDWVSGIRVLLQATARCATANNANRLDQMIAAYSSSLSMNSGGWALRPLPKV